jgi:signal transduction histidine kinase
VLFNLIGNALKFTFEGGVTVNFDFNPESRKIESTVTDTGVGIAQEDIKRLFQFFETVRSHSNINRSGIGLGLTISKLIVELLGGKIGVESSLDRGSKFSFELEL